MQLFRQHPFTFRSSALRLNPRTPAVELDLTRRTTPKTARRQHGAGRTTTTEPRREDFVRVDRGQRKKDPDGQRASDGHEPNEP